MPVSPEAVALETSNPPTAMRRFGQAVIASPVRTAALFAALGRLLFSAIAALYASHLVLDPATVNSNKLTEHLMSQNEGWKYALLGVWERFDTLWYMHIAQVGYDRPDSVVFYPLYPGLIALTHLPTLFASVLISTICSFFFAWGFQKLVLLDYDPEVGIRALILYLAWPAGFMLFAGYPESLLLCCVVWAIYFARTNHPNGTAAMALLAGGTKALGMLVVLPILFIAIRNMRWRVLAAAFAAFVGPAAMALWMNQAGRMSTQQVYATYWFTTVMPPWQTLWHSLLTPAPFIGLNMLALCLVALFAFAFADRVEYSLFALGVLWIVLTKETFPVLQSTSRYVMLVFPAFISAARVLRSRARFAAFAFVLGIIAINVFERFLNWWLIV